MVVYMYRSYSDVSNELIPAAWLSILFFNWIAYSSYHKLKVLYTIIVKNEKLALENRKIIEAFPHAVLIQSKYDWYTNNEFDSNIAEIQGKLDNLNNIIVKIGEDIINQNNSTQINFDNCQVKRLSELLLNHSMKLEKSSVVEQHSVYIELRDSEEQKLAHTGGAKDTLSLEMKSGQYEESTSTLLNSTQKGQYWNIKSMEVLWSGVPAIMHVFIDTTNILKLEQANNNIKWHKIMFASVSHEFRTPLNAILNSNNIVAQAFEAIIQSVNNKVLDQEMKSTLDSNSLMIKKFSRIGKHSCELLLALVEDVLNLSKIEANTFTVNCEEFNVPDLINEVTEVFEFQCQRKKIKLDVNIDEGLNNEMLLSDRGRIKQALINLLSNSFKFTFKGGITIDVKICMLENQRSVQFSVTDTGVGIPKKDQSKLFKMFGMLDETKKLNPNGCGIGLTVSKKYVELLEGQFSMNSEVNEGTTMRFIVPKLSLNKFERLLDNNEENKSEGEMGVS